MSRPSEFPRRLLVRAPNWVGDLVMATPVLLAAAEDERVEELVIAVRAHLAGVLAGGPLERHVVPLERGKSELAQLRELAPDAALLLSNSFGAAWRAWRARIPMRAGAALSGRGLLLTHSLVPPRRAGRRVPIPTAHLLRDVAGLYDLAPSGLHPRLWVTPEDEEQAASARSAAGLEPGTPYVVICPGAAYGAAKLWPPERFAAAARELCVPRGWRAMAVGGPGEEQLVSAVAQAAPELVSALPLDPRGLQTLKAHVRDCELVLVGDSGPRWYAAAFDKPCVSVMGPNSPELTASSLEHCRVVRVEGLECSPCLERVCPLGHHRCMQDLHVGSVVAAARELLAEPVA